MEPSSFYFRIGLTWDIINTLEKEVSMILDEYPKELTLKDGSNLTARPMVPEDEGALLAFFQSLSEAERLYLRDDVSDPAVIKGWAESVDYNRVLPILALDGDRIVGDATLHRKPHSWMRHVGEIRIVVSSEYREKGLARLLSAEVFQNAVTSGLEKLIAEMLTDQHDARRVFGRMGFREEAILKDQVLDVDGNRHDLLIMSNDVTRLWDKWNEFSESISGTWNMED
jgi:RimJ/RimL family protein N-acetyltransferase